MTTPTHPTAPDGTPPVTARGRGVVLVKAYCILLLILSAFDTIGLLAMDGAARATGLVLNIATAGLALHILIALPNREKSASTAAGLAILTAALLIAHGAWTNPRPPGGDAFFTLLIMAKSTLLLIPLAVYLYLDRLRRHGYLT